MEKDNEIPVGYEKLVLEPFFRLRPLIDESTKSIEKFGFGLGLTLVDIIYALAIGLPPGIAWATNASSIYRNCKGSNLMLTDIAKKNNAVFWIHTGVDHSKGGQGKCVPADLFFPISR